MHRAQTLLDYVGAVLSPCVLQRECSEEHQSMSIPHSFTAHIKHSVVYAVTKKHTRFTFFAPAHITCAGRSCWESLQEEDLCRVALTCHSAPDGIVRTDPLELFCLEPGSVVVVLRVMTDELQDGGKNEIVESERWSSYAVDEDDETSSGTEHSLFT